MSFRTWIGTIGAAATLGIAAACSAAGTDSAVPFTLEYLDPLPGTLAAAPHLSAGGGRVVLSWIERGSPNPTLRFSERLESGWSAPRDVISSADLMVSAADVPSVRPLADGSLVAHWLEANGPDPEGYDLLLSWSGDGGHTWSTPVTPHHDGTATQHGFVSIFEIDGDLGLAWLDGRALAANESAESGSRDMALRASAFTLTATGPTGQQPDVVLDPRVCECCPTSAAQTSEGVIVAYRGRSARNVRDIIVTRLTTQGWTPGEAVHKDNWTTSTCPINGPSVSASGHRVVVSWFTMHEARGTARAAFSADAGRTFGPAIQVDDGWSSGRVQTAMLDDGAAAVAWIEYADGQSQLRLRRVEVDGERSPSVTVARGVAGQYPRLVAGRGELVLAWLERSGESTRVRTAVVPVAGSAQGTT